jgi:hypothetical protein
MNLPPSEDKRIFDLIKSVRDTLEPIIICMTCPDRDRLIAEAQATGRLVSHGYCATCALKVMKEEGL